MEEEKGGKEESSGREREKEGEKERQRGDDNFHTLSHFSGCLIAALRRMILVDNRMNCYYQNRNMYMCLQSVYLRKVIG